MKLRDYQEDALQAIRDDIEQPGASLVVMPTASGKSHVIAAAAVLRPRVMPYVAADSDVFTLHVREWGIAPVLILQPSQELLVQNMAKLALLVPSEQIGVYSASFGRKEIKTFTFATIQSVYKTPELFKHIHLVILDEAHGMAVRSLGTMYTSFLRGMGNPKVLGFTATPYRLELAYYRDEMGNLQANTMLKLINRMRHKSQKEMFWKRIIYHVPHRKLLAAGWLAPLEYIDAPLLPYREIPVNVSHSDYNLHAYVNSIIGREADIISTIAEAQRRFKSVLVFCATTEQARHLSEVIKGSAVVLGDSDKKKRRQIVEDFKAGRIKTVFNVGTLTTGFDHPALDCVILLRPTRSLPLYNQMLGRLTRTAVGKTYGTVIDLTGTCKAMGKIETFELYRNDRNLWDLRTEKHHGWHDRILFSFAVQQ